MISGRLAAGYSGYLYEGNCVPPWDNPVGYWLSVGPDPFALPGNLLFPCDAGVLGCFGNGPGEAWKWFVHNSLPARQNIH